MSYYDFLDKKSLIKKYKKHLVLISSILICMFIIFLIIKISTNGIEKDTINVIPNYRTLTKEDEQALLNRMASGTPINILTKEQEKELEQRIK